jgi:tetratricopeptide (TPR) repeat protein
MAVDIGFIISAQNNATAELERVGRTFDDLGTRATKTTQTFSQTGRQVRLLAGEISTELNPALGSVVARATQATGAVGGMGVGMAGATVAIVAGAAALGAYLRNLNETAERQAILNVAVRSFDAGPMRQQLQAVSVEMEKQSVLSLGLIGRLEVMARKVTDAIGFTTAEISKRTDAQAALARVLPVEREQMLAEAYKDQANALQTLVATEIQRAERISSLEKVIELQQRLVQEINREADAEQRLIEIRRQIDEVRKKGDKDELAKAIKGYTAILDKQIAKRKGEVKPDFIRVLADCYSSMGEHGKAATELGKIPDPRARPNSDEDRMYKGVQIQYIRELRQSKTSENLAKARSGLFAFLNVAAGARECRRTRLKNAARLRDPFRRRSKLGESR